MTFGVRGQVLGENGRPLADARVILGPDLRTVQTDIGGRFRFDGLDDHTRHRVWAREGDYYTPFAFVNPEHEIELRMRRGTTLIVRVLADGLPLAGATVALARTIHDVTDTRGIVTFRGVPPEQFRGQVIAEGRATYWLIPSIDEAHAGDVIERTIDMAPGAAVSGRVLDEQGAPVGAIRVFADRPAGDVCSWTTTNADGTWSLALPAGHYQLSAMEKGRARVLSTLVCDGRTPQRDLVIHVGNLVAPPTYGRVAGIVVDEHGRPAQHARVRVSRPSEAGKSIRLFEFFGLTDQAGRFETHDLEVAGELDVVTSWRDWTRSEVRHRATVGDLDVRVVLPVGATLTGRAFLDGAPVPYFGVRVCQSHFWHSPTAVRSDEGRFEIPHVPPGTWQVGLIAPGSRAAKTREVEVVADETIEVGDVFLVRGYRLSGVVRDRHGAPVEDARVLVGRLAMLKHAWSRLESLFHGVYETRTDAEGRYTLDGLDGDRAAMAGPEIVSAMHPIAGLSPICEVPKFETTLDFTLIGRGRIEGVVHNAGRGLALSATRSNEPAFSRHVSVDHDGHFAADVPPGEYEVQVRLSKHEPSAMVTVVDGQTASVTLALPGTLARVTLIVPFERGSHVRFETSDGKPVEGIRGLSSTGTEDHMTVERAEPGTYRAMFDDQTWLAFVVGDAPEQTIDLRLIAG